MNPSPFHVDYFAFIDSFAGAGGVGRAGGGCPAEDVPALCSLCAYIIRKKEGFFENLLYEGINDKYLRRDFIRDGGLCSHHVNELLDRRENAAIAILYEQIFADATEAAAKRKTVPGSNCMLCSAIETWRHMYLTLFKKHMNDEAIVQTAGNCGGFCLPHERLLERTVRRPPSWFEEMQKGAAARRLADIRSFLNGVNYSAGSDTAGGKSKPVRDLVRALYGHEKSF